MAGSFYPIIVGTFILSLANPIYLSAQNIICNKWFADNERALATTITGIGIPVGSITAFVWSGIVFADI